MHIDIQYHILIMTMKITLLLVALTINLLNFGMELKEK